MKRLIAYGVILVIGAIVYGLFYQQMSQGHKVKVLPHVALPSPAPATSTSLPTTRTVFAPSRSLPWDTPSAKTQTPMERALAKASLDLDEKAIATLIDEMGSGDFQKRDQAMKKLKALGPEGMPALQKYRDNEDPEIASRVNALIQSFEWMKKGAIVLGTEFGEQAYKLGIKPGDVIVKVNETPVLGRATVAQVTPDQPRTLVIWRAGKIVPMQIAPGLIGVRLADWSLDKGGNDQARGLALFERGGQANTIEASRRLRSARQAGMDDRATIGLLACLAAQQLDHDYALECYTIFRGDNSTCELTHRDMQEYFHDLPFSSPHSEFLLGRYRNEPWSPLLYHELEDWFCRAGRNYPMLEKVLGEPWGPGTANLEIRRWDADSRLEADVMDRRWDDALRDYANDPDFTLSGDNRHTCAMMAAIYTGRVDKAVDIAMRLLTFLKEDPSLVRVCGSNVWYAIEAAAATGDATKVERISRGLQDLDEKTLDLMVRSSLHTASFDVGAAEYTLPVFDQLTRNGRAPAARHAFLALLAAAPTTTLEKFNEALGSENEENDDVNITALLRFGACDKARALWEKHLQSQKNVDPQYRNRVAAVFEFAANHAQRLAADWSTIRGFIQVADGIEKDTHWVLRWDGAVFFIDAGGKVNAYPGLPPAPVPLYFDRPYLRIGKTVSIAFIERPNPYVTGWMPQNPPYLLDRAAGKWVNAYETKLDLDAELPGNQLEARRAAVIRYVNKTYPLPKGEVPRAYFERNFSDLCFEGDLYFLCTDKDMTVVDLSAEVAAAANLNRPARIYDSGRLILSDVGLFQRLTGKVERVNLPLLKDQNVHLCYLDGPAYRGLNYGGALIGVAPQDGGQVFVVEKDGVIHPTNGYCGLGPRDWFASQLNHDTGAHPPIGDAIHRLYYKHKGIPF